MVQKFYLTIVVLLIQQYVQVTEASNTMTSDLGRCFDDVKFFSSHVRPKSMQSRAGCLRTSERVLLL